MNISIPAGDDLTTRVIPANPELDKVNAHGQELTGSDLRHARVTASGIAQDKACEPSTVLSESLRFLYADYARQCGTSQCAPACTPAIRAFPPPCLLAAPCGRAEQGMESRAGCVSKQR